MLRGLQAGFGDPLGAALLGHLAARGVQMVRLDLQGVPTAPMAFTLIDEAVRAGLRPLLIIQPAQAPWFTTAIGYDLEILNEPDLHGWRPHDYAAAVREVAHTLDGRHRLWAGCVSNCSSVKLAWLRNVVGELPLEVGLTVHRYPKNGGRPTDAQVGFRSREAEVEAIRALAGDRPWGCSEFGFHNGEQRTGWWLWTKRWHWTDDQVAAFVRQEWELWALAGASFAVLYQLNDGQSGHPLDRYGIRRLDGSWKPSADTFTEEG